MTPTRAILSYELPLAEMIYDLYDKLKSSTRGYGTMDFEIIGFKDNDLVPARRPGGNGAKVDALSIVVHRGFAERRGRKLVKKLKAEIDRHQFEVAIQAAIGSRVDRPRDDLRFAKERHRQVLRRRRLAEAQTVGEAEGRQEADEASRQRRNLAGSLPLRPRRRG